MKNKYILFILETKIIYKKYLRNVCTWVKSGEKSFDLNDTFTCRFSIKKNNNNNNFRC